ncbi:hypothetical protein AA313_de0202392 [Arthrobotrys entomopaga]|nr:hypothetical protein AA313_de0202392 [Arthrobotrys entomopaga]
MGYIPQTLIRRHDPPHELSRRFENGDYVGNYLRIVFAIIGVLIFFIIFFRILWWCRNRDQLQQQQQHRQAEDAWWWQRWHHHNQWQWNQQQAELRRQRDIQQRQIIHQRNLERQERWRQQRERQQQQQQQRQQRNTRPNINMGTVPTPQPAMLRMHFVARPQQQPPPPPPPVNFALLVVNVPTGDSTNQGASGRTVPTAQVPAAEGITRVGSDNRHRNQHERVPSRSQTRTPGGSDLDPPPAYKP